MRVRWINLGWRDSRNLLCVYFVSAFITILFLGANQDETILLLLAIFSLCASPFVFVARLFLNQKRSSELIGACVGLLAPAIGYELLRWFC